MEGFIDNEALEVPAGVPMADEDDLFSSSSSSGDEEEEDEEDEEEDAGRSLQRSQAFIETQKGFKRPFFLEAEEEEEELCDGTPDLAEYFAKFGLPNESQIAMCRTYANYLAALTRPKKYNKTEKKK